MTLGLPSPLPELRLLIPDCERRDLVGSSPKIRQVANMIRMVADLDAPVFVHGETGTGKEVIARAIHRWSSRPDRPFVAISCGAIPETLLESELFGHEKGAFTGSVGTRKGSLEEARRWNGVLASFRFRPRSSYCESSKSASFSAWE